MRRLPFVHPAWCLLFALAIVTGCRSSDDAGDTAGADATADPRGAPQVLPASGAGDTATLVTPQGPAFVSGDSSPGARDVIAEPLQWTADAVLVRLRDAGLAPVSRGSIAPDAMGVAGLRIAVANGAGEVQAFIFADPGAVGRAMRQLDLARLSTGGRSASIVTDNNMGAAVVTADEKVRERIRFALIARRGEGR
jgi:hypothetical protein